MYKLASKKRRRRLNKMVELLKAGITLKRSIGEYLGMDENGDLIYTEVAAGFPGDWVYPHRKKYTQGDHEAVILGLGLHGWHIRRRYEGEHDGISL